MIVVSDTSALIVLSKLNRLKILRTLYGSVLIPPEVHSELADQAAKFGITDILAETTAWLLIQKPQVVISFKGLHPGETAAIALAKELSADFLIMDEKNGRKVAAQEQVQTIGTIGVLEKAAEAGLLDLADTFEKLKQMKFHVTAAFLDERLKKYNDDLHRRQVAAMAEMTALNEDTGLYDPPFDNPMIKK